MEQHSLRDRGLSGPLTTRRNPLKYQDSPLSSTRTPTELSSLLMLPYIYIATCDVAKMNLLSCIKKKLKAHITIFIENKKILTYLVNHLQMIDMKHQAFILSSFVNVVCCKLEINCHFPSLQLVDDSLNEATEQFEVQLVSTSFGSRLGPISKATILIDGPNDGMLPWLQGDRFFQQQCRSGACFFLSICFVCGFNLPVNSYGHVEMVS